MFHDHVWYSTDISHESRGRLPSNDSALHEANSEGRSFFFFFYVLVCPDLYATLSFFLAIDFRFLPMIWLPNINESTFL